MSKIYEALLRAEQDRNARDSDHAPRADSASQRKASSVWSAVATMEAEATPLQAAGPEADVQAFEPLHEPLPELLSHASRRVQPTPAAAPALAPPLDILTFRSWKPVLAQLPALLERGAAVEQFRSLRSRLQEFRDLNALKSIMISSGVPQEGKTFIAANLAVSLARHDGSRVLLIDGDMRRPSLHKMFGAPNQPGLTDYLAGKATIDEVMQHARRDDPEAPVPAGLHSLTFIAGGGEPELAADLSGSDRFTDLMLAASPLFDWIIVDSSPVNLIADGVNLARACDGVLLVARGGVTKFEVAQRALAELKAAKVLGIVLNAVVDPPVAEGYYGYDGYVGRSVDSK